MESRPGREEQPTTVPTSSDHDRERQGQTAAERARSGQIIVLFAFFLTACIGIVGLATDLGIAFAQKRTVQNAADAAALAGARELSRVRPGQTIQINVESTARNFSERTENRMGTSDQLMTDCNFVNDAQAVTGDCNNGTTVSNLPGGSSGVRVRVREEHQTFFIRVLPGAPDRIPTSATATAQVRRFGAPIDGPFMVCGVDTRLNQNGNHRLDIVTKSGGNWVVNTTANNREFLIHGPQVETCDGVNANFKGYANGAQNALLSGTFNAPGWLHYDTGNKAGHIEASVDGVQGCLAGQEVNNCVAFLPVAVNDPKETASSLSQQWVVMFLPFYITHPKSNEHVGRLLLDYSVNAPGQTGWGPNYIGATVIRLVA